MTQPRLSDCPPNSTKGKLLFRGMDESDIGAYCTLFKRVFASPPWNERWPLKKIERTIGGLMRRKGFVGVVALAGDERIGFVAGSRPWILPKVFYLAQLFVDDALRGRGIGNGMLRETAAIAKERGVATIILLTKPYSRAEKFYCRFGFSRWLSPFRIRGKCILKKNL